MISRFIALLPRSDSRGSGNQRARPRGLPPQFSSLPSVFLSLSPLPLLLVDLFKSSWLSAPSSFYTHLSSELFHTLAFPPPRPPSIPRLPDLIYHCGGSVSQACCYQSARGRWDDERASEQGSVWAFVRKWLPPRCFYFGGCVCVCVFVTGPVCMCASAPSSTQMYVFPFVLPGECSYNTKQVRLRGIRVPVTK